MGILTWLLVGAIAGWLANRFVGGSSVGVLGDILLGIIGAFVGVGLAGRVFGVQSAISGFNLTTVVVAFVGAAVVLAIVNAVG